METFVKLYDKKNPKNKNKQKKKNREFKTIIFICRSKVQNVQSHSCPKLLFWN